MFQIQFCLLFFGGLLRALSSFYVDHPLVVIAKLNSLEVVQVRQNCVWYAAHCVWYLLNTTFVVLKWTFEKSIRAKRKCHYERHKNHVKKCILILMADCNWKVPLGLYTRESSMTRVCNFLRCAFNADESCYANYLLLYVAVKYSLYWLLQSLCILKWIEGILKCKAFQFLGFWFSFPPEEAWTCNVMIACSDALMRCTMSVMLVNSFRRSGYVQETSHASESSFFKRPKVDWFQRATHTDSYFFRVLVWLVCCLIYYGKSLVYTNAKWNWWSRGCIEC